MKVSISLKSGSCSTFGCKMGAFLPIEFENTRNTADAISTRAIPLDRPLIEGSIDLVVAVPPQWAETHSLIRYPSPYGRSRAFTHRPPFFLRAARILRNRRRVAINHGASVFGFDRSGAIALNRATINQNKTRGFIRCVSNPHSSCLPWPSSGLRPAATHLANRLLSAQAPGPARRLSSAAALQRAPLSARRATSLIVRPIQTAADPHSRVLTGASIFSQTTGAHGCAGGFSFSIARASGALSKP